MPTSTKCREMAAVSINLLSKEGKFKNAAQQSIVYTLCLMHTEKVLPQVDLTKAFKLDSQTEQRKRNEALLHHLFDVVTLQTDEKTQRQFYKPKENLGFNVAVLKTRINRSLAVVAHIIRAAEQAGGLGKVVEQNKDHTLSVIGSVFYSEDDLENAPNLAKNWVTLSGKSTDGHGTFNRLQRVADASLGYSRAVTRRRKVQVEDIAELPIPVIAKSLAERLARMDEGDKLSRWAASELQSLAEIISATMEVVSIDKRGRKPKVGRKPRVGAAQAATLQ